MRMELEAIDQTEMASSFSGRRCLFLSLPAPFPRFISAIRRAYQGDSAFYCTMQRKKTPDQRPESRRERRRYLESLGEGGRPYPIARYRVLGEN